jgi:DNA-binding LytR/AlgR family response regulator
MDIELADGQSFEIFSLTEVKGPVIFTTSYDEYALKAFKVNSVDYLLKPIRKMNCRMHSASIKR